VEPGAHDIAVALHLLARCRHGQRSRAGLFAAGHRGHGVFYAALCDGRLAHSHVSWLDPHKVRRLTVVGSRQMAVFDDVEPSEKLRIYDKAWIACPSMIRTATR